MEWLKKHADAVVVLTTVVGAAIWMISSLHSLKEDIGTRFNSLEKEMAIIKTVLVMKEVMPKELAFNEIKE